MSKHGETVDLELGADGRPRVMISTYNCDFLGDEGIYYAVAGAPTGPFALDAVPATSAGGDRVADMELDRSDQPHAIFWRFTDAEDENHYLVGADTGWTSTILDAPSMNVATMAVAPGNAVDLLAQGGSGTWYLTNRTGSFGSKQITDAFSVWSNAADVVVDLTGRPHLLFAVGDYDATRPGLFYAIGPSQ